MGFGGGIYFDGALGGRVVAGGRRANVVAVENTTFIAVVSGDWSSVVIGVSSFGRRILRGLSVVSIRVNFH